MAQAGLSVKGAVGQAQGSLISRNVTIASSDCRIRVGPMCSFHSLNARGDLGVGRISDRAGVRGEPDQLGATVVRIDDGTTEPARSS